jgi:hypothetical protein
VTSLSVRPVTFLSVIYKAWQNKLASGVDGPIVRAHRPHRLFGMADMTDPVSLDDNERIGNRVAPRSVAGGVEATKAAFLAAVNRGEWNKADHLFLWLWDHAPRIEAFDLLLSVAIPKNFNDDHYFMFPGTMWRAFDKGVLDKADLPVLMRPVVRFVTRSPVAPPNPIASPLPQIEALIEEHRLLQRIYRQRSGEDETATIG